MGTPRGLQRLVFVMGRAIAFTTEEAVLEGVLVGDVGSGSGFELGEFVGGIWGGAEQCAKERLQVGLEWVGGTGAVVEAFMCSSWWRL